MSSANDDPPEADMKLSTLTSLWLLAPAAIAVPQTQELYRIDRPVGAPGDWSSNMAALPDLTGDGVEELILAGRNHGTGAERVFSGADGSALFEIVQPNLVLFWGRGMTGVGDLTGDGIPEIAIAGAHSGDANSPDGRLQIYSGADGSLVHAFVPPAGVIFREDRILALDDVDGDGALDVLVRTAPGIGIDAPQMQLFSSATGLPLYSGVNDLQSTSILHPAVRTSDHDGDGHADFMIVVSRLGGRSLEIHSGRTGELLHTLTSPGIDLVTGNGEPLITLADRNADGLEDFAVGGVFSGHVGAYTSSDASLLREWDCSGTFCLGTSLLNVGDLNADGHEDLLTLEHEIPFQPDTSLLALDIETGERIFAQPITGVSSGYGMSDALIRIEGAAEGSVAFALFEFQLDAVVVRHVDWSLGSGYCSATPNSTGAAASISASGSSSVAENNLHLCALDLPAGQPMLFYYGGGQTAASFGNGLRCVGAGASGVFRLPVLVADTAGHAHYTIDNTLPPSAAGSLAAGSTWNFQGWYRDPAGLGAGFNLTDGLELVFER